MYEMTPALREARNAGLGRDMRYFFAPPPTEVGPQGQAADAQQKEEAGGDYPIDIQSALVNLMHQERVEQGTGDLGDANQGNKLPVR
jgi:hypothetical protein